MAEHRHAHHYPSRRRSGIDVDRSNVGLIEALVDLTIAVVAACGRLVARGIRWLRGGPTQGPGTAPAYFKVRRRDDKRERRARIEATLRRWAAHPVGDTAHTSGRGPERLPYRRVPHLLSKGERAFWYPLYRAVKGQYRIFCKVRLADIVRAPADDPEERRWFRKIGRYHVDFVICDPSTTEPLLVVELDDRTHRSAERRERDRFKQKVLTAGGVPLYRVPAQVAYDPQELSDAIRGKIAGI